MCPLKTNDFFLKWPFWGDDICRTTTFIYPNCKFNCQISFFDENFTETCLIRYYSGLAHSGSQNIKPPIKIQDNNWWTCFFSVHDAWMHSSIKCQKEYHYCKCWPKCLRNGWIIRVIARHYWFCWTLSSTTMKFLVLSAFIYHMIIVRNVCYIADR